MSGGDARAVAWMAAWNRVEAATEFRVDLAKQKGASLNDPLPPSYWVLMAEADVFARLADTDMAIGVAAWHWMDAIERRKREQEDAEEAVRTAFMERGEPGAQD